MEITVQWNVSYGLPVVNSEYGYQFARRTAEEYLGADSWQELERPFYAMEDFAYYLPGREGCMSWLGLGESYPPLHSSHFDFNDDVLARGIDYFALLALTWS